MREEPPSNFYQLLSEHRAHLKAYITALFPDFATANDLYQDVCGHITKQAATYDPGSPFLPWAAEVVRSRLLALNRTRSVSPQALSNETMGLLFDDSPGFEGFEERIEALKSSIDSLAPNARKVIDMRYRLEQRPEGIARRLSWETESVFEALSRARVQLRESAERKLGKV
jgi:RNA polymerase sigma factor (sigma-70 family)